MNEQELKEIEEQIHSCPSNEYGCDCCPKRLYIPKLIQEIRRLQANQSKTCGSMINAMRFEGNKAVYKSCSRSFGHTGNHYDGFSEWSS